MRQNGKRYLNSAIIVRAEAKCRLSTIEKAMEGYPSARAIRRGTSLLYSIEEDSDRCYEIELSQSYMRLGIFSESSPLYFMKDAMLKLLSICSFLQGKYSVDISSIFPYLIELLADGQIGHYREVSAGIQYPQSDSYIVLAKRINFLRAEKSALEAKLKSATAEADNLLEGILVSEAVKAPSSIDALSEKYKVSARSFSLALENLKKKGWKVINNGSLFTLVNI